MPKIAYFSQSSFDLKDSDSHYFPTVAAYECSWLEQLKGCLLMQI